MEIKNKTNGQILILQFSGDIDEDAVFPEVESKSGQTITLDLDLVHLLNSCGIREWMRWIKPIAQSVQLIFKNCTKVVIDQMNTVDGFLPSGSFVESFKVPYFCVPCDQTTAPTFMTAEVKKGQDLHLPGSVPCSLCRKEAEMDVVPERYFKFLRNIS